MRHLPAIFLSFALAVVAAGQTRAAEPTKPLDLKDGDRVALIGDAFIERQQASNYLEAALTARFAKQNITFRNLGWSGDTVFGEARAVFGKAPEGFARLMKDLAECKPTVILVCYGANEANAGEAGLPVFTAGLEKLLTELAKLNARVVLLSPIEREKLPPPLPDPAEYNKVVATYAGAIAEVAAKRGLVDYNLQGLVPHESASPPKPLDQLTDNGLHLSAYGYWRTTPPLMARLGCSPGKWSVETNVTDNETTANGTTVKRLKSSGPGFLCEFVCTDEELPLGPPPAHSPAGAIEFATERTLKIAGLAPGKYDLKVDDQSVASATSEQWAAGVRITAGPEFAQTEQLRAAINVKNQFYFHRYRPENETYLFLFRKHEQGNNAVEIPQFDPLIAEQEKQIASLRQPKPHTYSLTKAP